MSTSYRCECGKLASLSRACKACGSDDHLRHCHCPGFDGKVQPGVAPHWRTCDKTHVHALPMAGHEHDGGAK